MNKMAVVKELVAVAKELTASAGVGSAFRLLKDISTKAGAEFKTGEEVRIREYSKGYPWVVKLEAVDGRKMSLLVEGAYAKLSGFPKPPSLATMMRWSDEGVSRSVDGQRVEPDGFSSGGAPSWILVSGAI